MRDRGAAASSRTPTVIRKVARLVAMNEVLRRENEAIAAQNAELRDRLAEIATILDRLTPRRGRRPAGPRRRNGRR